jgi:hypothetical protein
MVAAHGRDTVTKFANTDLGAEFIASGASRETSVAVMEAIAFFARDEKEAEEFWNGDFAGRVDFLSIWENASNNGQSNAELHWGDIGEHWADEFVMPGDEG